ncbi:MAG TPA: hypothetical protein VD994_13760, partial [Prosthecobacter sp.]|nr:hypothetical protein [Prosthecobacter sp.]
DCSSSFVGSIDNVTLVRVDSGSIPAILSDSPLVYLRYVRRVKEASVLPGAFKNALSLRLAMVLAAGLPDGGAMKSMLNQELRATLSKAKSEDGIEDMPERFPAGSWVTARGGGYDRSWSWGRR